MYEDQQEGVLLGYPAIQHVSFEKDPGILTHILWGFNLASPWISFTAI